MALNKDPREVAEPPVMTWNRVIPSYSIAVSLRMDLMPLPRRGHDGIEVGKFRLPAEIALDRGAVGDEPRDIASAALNHFTGNGVARNSPHRFDHFQHGKPLSIAQIVNS